METFADGVHGGGACAPTAATHNTASDTANVDSRALDHVMTDLPSRITARRRILLRPDSGNTGLAPKIQIRRPDDQQVVVLKP
jgi:hypothetical protein